jgi:hypothetical protein
MPNRGRSPCRKEEQPFLAMSESGRALPLWPVPRHAALVRGRAGPTRADWERAGSHAPRRALHGPRPRSLLQTGRVFLVSWTEPYGLHEYVEIAAMDTRPANLPPDHNYMEFRQVRRFGPAAPQPSASPGGASPLPHLHRDRGSLLRHPHWDWAHPSPSPLPHLRRDRVAVH